MALVHEYDVDINTTKVRKVADLIKSNNEYLRDHFNDIDHSLFDLFNHWDGPAKLKAHKRYQLIKKIYQDQPGNRYDVINNYVELLQDSTASGYELAEDKNKKMSTAYKDMYK